MSQTVAKLLVDTSEKTAVKQIFGLIGDSLYPPADAVRGSRVKRIGVRHEETDSASKCPLGTDR
jgi:pyruvate dehydrogenase (quinone)